jgi:hypothetical protein
MLVLEKCVIVVVHFLECLDLFGEEALLLLDLRVDVVEKYILCLPSLL